MVFPLYDDNPFTKQTVPVVTWTLIAINVVVFLFQLSSPDETAERMTASLGFTPASLVGDVPQSGELPSSATLLTNLFMHGGFGHIFGNMLYLFIFGDDIEEALGWARYIVFYLVGGVLASLAYFAIDPHSQVVLIGASGAISAILAAYLMVRPCARVTVLVFRVTMRLRAIWVIGGWVLLQAISMISAENDGVAYIAHFGGLAAGVLLFPLLKPGSVKLFQCIDPEEGGTPRLS